VRIGKLFKFEAAHQLKNWPEDHQCHRLHGHSYKVEVVISGNIAYESDKPFVVVDFADLSEAWSYVHKKFDHRNLNEVMGTDDTTAELIALTILSMMQTKLEPKIESVRVWETDTAWAEARQGL
jgi:6-pyruvoyltetrahydropterin/6-carboxytetrahydropterin synthase